VVWLNPELARRVAGRARLLMPSTNVVYTAGIEFGNIRRTALDGDATPRAGSPWSFCRFQHRGFGDVAVESHLNW